MATAIELGRRETCASGVEVRAYRGGPELVDAFSHEWRGLCDEGIEDQPFFRPEWIGAFLRQYEPGAKILLIIATIDGRPAMILPLIQEVATYCKVPVRRLRVPVNDRCARFDAACRRGPNCESAITAIWQFLCEMQGWDLLQIRDALEGSTTSCLAKLARQDGFRTLQEADQPSPLIPIPSSPSELQMIPSNSKLRSQLRQIRLRLNSLGTLKFSRTSEADPVVLERFYRLEASGWKGQTGTCVLNDGSRPFYDEVTQAAARYGYLSLYTLELNDILIAGHLCFTHKTRCYSPKVAYNEDYKQFAPGHLIIAEIIKDCSQRGIRVFDITGQDQPWKMKWTSQARPVNHYFIFKGPAGALAHTVGLQRNRARTSSQASNNE